MLNNTAIFFTFTIRSKRRLNKVVKTTPLFESSKTTRRQIIAPAIDVRLLQQFWNDKKHLKVAQFENLYEFVRGNSEICVPKCNSRFPTKSILGTIFKSFKMGH